MASDHTDLRPYFRALRTLEAAVQSYREVAQQAIHRLHLQNHTIAARDQTIADLREIIERLHADAAR